MASAARTQAEVRLPPLEASESVAAVLEGQGYTLDEDFVPGEAELLFYAKRTVLYVKRAGVARITPQGTGSLIELGLDVAPGKPAGLLDGKHNRKLLDELRDAIIANLGPA